MTIQINIDDKEKTASLGIINDTGATISWESMDPKDQVTIIYTLFCYTNLLQKSYLQEHPEANESVDNKVSEDTNNSSNEDNPEL